MKLHFNHQKTLLFTLLFFGLLILVQCTSPASNPQETTKKQENLTDLEIGYSRLRISLPVFVAQEKGFFEKHGIRASLNMYETAQPLMQALVAGQINAAGYTALPITFNGMIRSKKDLYFITTMVEDDQHRISYLIRPQSQEGNPPVINSIKDLAGKRIGILPTIAYKAWLEEILRKNGIDPKKDVVIQQISPTQQGQALKSGGVDALFTNDPAATSIIKLGIGELVSDEVEVPQNIQNPFPFGSFNVDKVWADENSEDYQNLVSALDEAVAYINTHPNESKKMMIPYLPEVFKEHVAHYPNALYWNTKQSKIETYQDVSDLYFSIGIIPEAINLDGLVH